MDSFVLVELFSLCILMAEAYARGKTNANDFITYDTSGDLERFLMSRLTGFCHSPVDFCAHSLTLRALPRVLMHAYQE